LGLGAWCSARKTPARAQFHLTGAPMSRIESSDGQRGDGDAGAAEELAAGCSCGVWSIGSFLCSNFAGIEISGAVDDGDYRMHSTRTRKKRQGFT